MADFGGRYRRDRLLGTGGMGEAWLAYDEELDDRPVAIKIMRSDVLEDDVAIMRFQRETQIASRMRHPNIMALLATGTDNGVAFMVKEYLDGNNLSERTSALDASHVARIGADTCAALAYAHEFGAVHGDIKPGNLFLCGTGQVKVTDFGVARLISGNWLSSTWVPAGTISYLAPERLLGGLAEFGNDIWAVGCVLYELLSGRPPRDYATAVEYAAAAVRGDRVSPLDSASAPPWLASAVMAMLEPEPASRPTAAECVELLAT
jgi:serine/threonine-protein kinase